ncbi:MAG: hypothetical protein FD188_3438, partial [Ignavibacteria bacterium]
GLVGHLWSRSIPVTRMNDRPFI